MGQLIDLIAALEDEVYLSKFSLKKCVLYSLDVVDAVLCFDHWLKAFTHCDLQNRVLLLLPPRCPRYVRVPRPPILPLRDANHRALRPRQIHPHLPRRVLPDPRRLS